MKSPNANTPFQPANTCISSSVSVTQHFYMTFSSSVLIAELLWAYINQKNNNNKNKKLFLGISCLLQQQRVGVRKSKTGQAERKIVP